MRIDIVRWWAMSMMESRIMPPFSGSSFAAT
jgi:hypothetical protein